MWTSSEYDTEKAWLRTLISSDPPPQDSIWRWRYDKNYALSVRCVRASHCGLNYYDKRNGEVYGTVKIGSQCWMAKNMNVGTKVNSLTGDFEQTSNGIIEKYCHNNDISYCDVYGGLYEWPEAMQYSTTEGAQGICPEGFTALPGGIRSYNDGGFTGLHQSAYFWSSSQVNSNDAHEWDIHCLWEYVLKRTKPKEGGFSIRCLKDSD